MVRSLFPSYSTTGRPLNPPLSHKLDTVWLSEAHWLAAAVPAHAHVAWVNISAFAAPRLTKMPLMADGMHWACISKQSERTFRCFHEYMTGMRPDEVAWAAVQVTLHMVCRAELPAWRHAMARATAPATLAMEPSLTRGERRP